MVLLLVEMRTAQFSWINTLGNKHNFFGQFNLDFGMDANWNESWNSHWIEHVSVYSFSLLLTQCISLLHGWVRTCLELQKNGLPWGH